MSDFPRQVHVKDLFGHLNPAVKLRLPERITILAGPNGSGKTHILRILRHTLDPDVVALSRLPFGSVELEYESGKTFRVAKTPGQPVVQMRVSGELPIGGSFKAGPFTIQLDPLEGIPLPEYLQRLDDEMWVDTRDGELIATEDVLDRYSRYGARRRGAERTLAPPEWPPDWVREHFTASTPTFIATARLDMSPAIDDAARTLRRPPMRVRAPGTVVRIRQYVDRIKDQVAEARRASLAVSQRADQEFAPRALDKARETVKERELHDRYERLALLHQELHANGLTAEAPGVSFPGKTNPTERRILNVFLQDWEEKLRPLVPVHEKLQLLRAVIGSKLLGKSLVIENGEPSFVSPASEPISVEMLSSGEQHLLALFTMLLFAAIPGSVVLVDEPEISLHAAWQHAFLDDISQVAAINNLQVVLATHSTAIINGRWELVEELELSN